MAIIYGRAAAEIDLLSIAPKSVQKIEDVETIHEELKEKLTRNPVKSSLSDFCKNNNVLLAIYCLNLRGKFGLNILMIPYMEPPITALEPTRKIAEKS